MQSAPPSPVAHLTRVPASDGQHANVKVALSAELEAYFKQRALEERGPDATVLESIASSSPGLGLFKEGLATRSKRRPPQGVARV